MYVYYGKILPHCYVIVTDEYCTMKTVCLDIFKTKIMSFSHTNNDITKVNVLNLNIMYILGKEWNDFREK